VSPDRADVADAPRTVSATAIDVPESPDMAKEPDRGDAVDDAVPCSTSAPRGTRTPASPVRALDTAAPETATEIDVAIPGTPAWRRSAAPEDEVREERTVALDTVPPVTATASAHLGELEEPS